MRNHGKALRPLFPRAAKALPATAFLPFRHRPVQTIIIFRHPDWGEMVSGTARRYFRSAPHLLWAPGICIILLTLSINLLGDLLRDLLDVKQDAVKEL